MNKKTLKAACAVGAIVVFGAGVINLTFDMFAVLAGRQSGTVWEVFFPYGLAFYLIPAAVLLIACALIRPDPGEKGDDVTEAFLSGNDDLIDSVNQKRRRQAAAKKAARQRGRSQRGAAQSENTQERR